MIAPFTFNLPPEFYAKEPPERRGSRALIAADTLAELCE
jgi:S-adenosylmethionine:tRNA-ribosyltransferase-isomerase (queuine synthetase)